MTRIARIRELLTTLETVGPSGQADLMVIAASTHGGYVKPPRPGDNWDNQRTEIHVHGVFGEGPDMAEAIRNWSRAATAEASANAERETDIRAAIATLISPGPTDPDALAQACNTIIAHPDLVSPATHARANGVAEALITANAL